MALALPRHGKNYQVAVLRRVRVRNMALLGLLTGLVLAATLAIAATRASHGNTAEQKYGQSLCKLSEVSENRALYREMAAAHGVTCP